MLLTQAMPQVFRTRETVSKKWLSEKEVQGRATGIISNWQNV